MIDEIETISSRQMDRRCREESLFQPSSERAEWHFMPLFNSSSVKRLNSPRRRSTKIASMICDDDSLFQCNSCVRRRRHSSSLPRSSLVDLPTFDPINVISIFIDLSPFFSKQSSSSSSPTSSSR